MKIIQKILPKHLLYPPINIVKTPKEDQESLLVEQLLGLKDTTLTSMSSGVEPTMAKMRPYAQQQTLMELYTHLKLFLAKAAKLSA